MKTSHLFVVLTAALGFFLGGCENTAPKLSKPLSTTTINLEPKGRAVLGTLSFNEAIRVVLPPPQQGPDYHWMVIGNNNKVTIQTSEILPVDKKAPNGSVWVTFQAIHQGRTIIRFAALKAGSAESEPKDLYQITIGVKLVQ